MMVKTPGQELDDGVLSRICDRSNSTCRMFVKERASGLGLLWVEGRWAELLLRMTGANSQ